MKALLLSGFGISIGVDKRKLVIKKRQSNEMIEFYPHQIPYDNVILDGHYGSISFEAMRWLSKHGIILSLLNWNGNLLSVTMPKEPISGKLKIKQYESYKDTFKRYGIALEIIRTKVEKSKTLLIALSDYYEVLNKDEISEVFGRELENFKRNNVIFKEKLNNFSKNRIKQKVNNLKTENFRDSETENNDSEISEIEKNRNKKNKIEKIEINRDKTEILENKMLANNIIGFTKQNKIESKQDRREILQNETEQNNDKIENNRNKIKFNYYNQPTKTEENRIKIEKNKENSENFDKMTLSDNYNFKNCGSDDFKKELNWIMTFEGRIADYYWKQLSKIFNELYPEFNFKSRKSKSYSWNMNASDYVNSLLNYGYAILESFIRRYINVIGLDQDIGFLHEMNESKTPLVYDLQELYRWLIDLSVIQVLEDKEIKKSDFIVTENYHLRLSESGIRYLLEKITLNLNKRVEYNGKFHTFDNILLDNVRKLAKFIEKEQKELRFEIPGMPIGRNDDIESRNRIMSMTPEIRKKLKINKSTLWYRQKAIKDGKKIKIYGKVVGGIR